MNFLAAFRRRRFLLLWTGQSASHLGDHIYEIALAWWVLQKTGSAATMGAVLIAAFLPTIIFVLIGGVLADRLPRVWVMLVSDCARLVLMLAMTAVAFSGRLPIGLVVALSALIGLLGAFFQPAYNSIFPELVPPDELTSANSVTSFSVQFAHIVGPAVGAGLVAVGGIPFAFALNSFSYLLSALTLIEMLRPPRKSVGGAEWTLAPASSALAPADVTPAPSAGAWSGAGRFWRDLREGIAATRELTWVWLTIALAGLANFANEGATSVALPYFIQHTLAASPLLYGGLTAAAAVGGALGAWWLGSRGMRRRGLLIYGTFVVGMLATTVVGLAPWPAAMLAAMFVEGLCVTALGLAWATALQQYIPLEKLGRVSSLDQLGSYVMIPLSYGLAGLLVDHYGARPVLIWAGLIAAAVVSLGFLSRSVRALD